MIKIGVCLSFFLLLMSCAGQSGQEIPPPPDFIFTIRGSVVAGASPIGGAQVTLVLEDMSPPVLHRRTSEPDGSFSFNFLVSSENIPYELTVDKSGFTTARARGNWSVRLEGGQVSPPIEHLIELTRSDH